MGKNIDSFNQPCYTFIEIPTGDDCMTSAEIIKRLIQKSEKKNKEVSDEMRMSQSAFSNKFKRNSFSADEFIHIVSYLGYELKIVDKDTNDDIKIKNKGIGERVKMMIKGVIYDTEKSDAICHSDENEESFDELYQDNQGRYFVAHYVKWEGGVNSISPIGTDDAIKFIEKYS